MKPANGRRLEWLGHANISTTRIDDQPPHAAGGQPYVQAQLSHRCAFGGMRLAEFCGFAACLSICGAKSARSMRLKTALGLDAHRFGVVALSS
jgi:hypothetical protein